MIEQFRVAAVRSIKQLAEVLKPVERFYPLIGAIGTEPIYDLDETFFEGMACQIQVAVLDFVEIPIDDDSDGLDIYGYTQIGRPTVVFGEGGSGNSYWALHLACTVAASGKRVGVAGELANEVRRRQLDFLIVDSASFSVSKTSDAEAVNAFFGQLGQFGCGSLILAYVVKSGRKEADIPFGSTSWHNQGRCGSSGTMRRPTVGRRCGSICGRWGWS